MSTLALILIAISSGIGLAYRRLWLRSVEREERWERIVDREVWARVAAMAAGVTVHSGTGEPKGAAGDCSSDADNSEALEVGNDSPACGSREARRHHASSSSLLCGECGAPLFYWNGSICCHNPQCRFTLVSSTD